MKINSIGAPFKQDMTEDIKSHIWMIYADLQMTAVSRRNSLTNSVPIA